VAVWNISRPPYNDVCKKQLYQMTNMVHNKQQEYHFTTSCHLNALTAQWPHPLFQH